MHLYGLSRTVSGGFTAAVLAASLLTTTALAEPPVDVSKWSPDYVRSIAGTETFDTVGHCLSSSMASAPTASSASL